MTEGPLLKEAVDRERIARHIRALEGVRHPVAAPEALERAADYLEEYLRLLGYHTDEQRFADNGATYRNVIATRTGLSRPEERVAVLAHYDTVATSPGADDNASGVAALLEMARVLAQVDFERTIHFVGVALEENAREDDPGSGLRGSRALARHAREAGWDLKGVLVLESIGYAGEDVRQSLPQGIPVPVPQVGNFIAVIGNESSRELTECLVRALARHEADLPHVALTVPGNGEPIPDTRRSDHAPFWDLGYPAIMLTDTTNFRSPHYHRPTDTIATLNLGFASKVCHAAAGAVLELAAAITR